MDIKLTVYGIAKEGKQEALGGIDLGYAKRAELNILNTLMQNIRERDFIGWHYNEMPQTLEYMLQQIRCIERCIIVIQKIISEYRLNSQLIGFYIDFA